MIYIYIFELTLWSWLWWASTSHLIPYTPCINMFYTFGLNYEKHQHLKCLLHSIIWLYQKWQLVTQYWKRHTSRFIELAFILQTDNSFMKNEPRSIMCIKSLVIILFYCHLWRTLEFHVGIVGNFKETNEIQLGQYECGSIDVYQLIEMRCVVKSFKNCWAQWLFPLFRIYFISEYLT